MASEPTVKNGFNSSTFAGIVSQKAAPSKFNDKVQELNVAVSQGFWDKVNSKWVEKSTVFVTVSGYAEHGDDLKLYEVGDKVLVENAKLELRAYINNKGEAAIGATAQYGVVSMVQSKAERLAAKDAPDDEDAPF